MMPSTKGDGGTETPVKATVNVISILSSSSLQVSLSGIGIPVRSGGTELRIRKNRTNMEGYDVLVLD